MNTSRLRSVCRAGLAALAGLSLVALARGAAPATGGWLSAGLRGAYFANPDLAGEPAFTRKDPRLDFDWGTVRAPGGSRGRGFNAVGTDNYSARWTGSLRTRFSEPHTFRIEADDGVRLRLRAAGSGTWTTLIDQWGAVGLQSHAAPAVPLVAGTTYELEVEYRELTGAASLRLLWSGPNTPEAVIDPATEMTVNWNTYDETTFADAIRNGRSNWESVAVDADGWPVGDGQFIVSEILSPHDPSPIETGRMRLTFRGSAQVGVSGNGFLVPGSYSYDAATNVSSAWIQGADYDSNVLALYLTNTRRTPASTAADGVTEVRLMRPVSPGSTEALPADELFHPASRSTYAERFTGLRFQRVNDQSRSWTERTSPRWPYQGTGTGNAFVYAARYGTADFGRSMMSHEYEIMLCNETGTDYMLSVPHLATTVGADSYLRQLARLVRNGSDENGVPYPAPVANPYHPPLNPNLRVYLEIGNELWNFLNRSVYSPYWDHRELVEDLADAYATAPGSPSGQLFALLNHDGLPRTQGPDGYHNNNYTWVRRYWGYLIRQYGEAFRAEFGDAAMPGSGPQPRIRPYFGYQYANANDTARIPLEFLDNVYNNAAGAFVAQPRPVNHWLFAAGGAGYYGSGNPTGATSGLLENASFETPVVAASTVAPAGASWTFNGLAGIVPNATRASAVAGYSLGALRNDAAGWFGVRFRTGANPGWVYELGRFVHTGNTRHHGVVLIRADTGALVTYTNGVSTSTGTPGSFAYAPCAPVRLEPDTSYVLLAEEENGYDQFADAVGTTVSFTAGSGLIGEGAVTAVQTSQSTWGSLVTTGAAGAGFGPLDLRLAAPAGLGNPDARDGSQVAWIARDAATGANGSVEIAFTAPASADGSGTPATYGLTFRAVQRSRTLSTVPDTQYLRLFAGAQEITYRGINGQPAAFTPIFPWQRISFWIGDYYFTEAFTLAPGQTITLRIEGAAPSGDPLCFLDDIRVTSVDAIFAGGIPDTGEATGQPNGGDYVQGLRADARWAQAYGLHHMTYEHGWSIGGDSGASPVQEHAKFRDPRAAQTMVDALAIFQRAGGANMTLGTYSTWPNFHEGIREEGVLNPTAYPLVQGLDAAWLALPAAPDNGVPVPAMLGGANAALAYGTSEPRVDAGEWLAWNIIVPERGQYRISLTTALLAGGSSHRLTVDETSLVLSAAPGAQQSTLVELTPGLHTLKWRGLSGALALTALVVTRDDAPAASPQIQAVVDDDSRLTVRWLPVAGATSYLVRYGTQPGFPNREVVVPAGADGEVLSAVLANLPNGIAQYLSVAARNGSAAGLPSAEVGATPFGDSTPAVLASWEFTGQPGYAVDATAALSSARVAAGLLTRGPGFGQAGWAPSGCFLGAAINWSQTLAGSVAAGHYVEFTLTPRHGRRASLTSLSYRAAHQNVNAANPADPRGTGISWRVGADGVFTNPIQLVAPRSASFNYGSLYEADLSAVPALQNTNQPVTFRIHFHGQSPYEGASLGGDGSDLAVRGTLASPPLTAWRSLHDLDPEGADDLEDPAGDGVANLLKYAFNLAPAVGDLAVPADRRFVAGAAVSGLPATSLEPVGGALRFEFVRRRASAEPGVVYLPRRSTDLVSWVEPASVPVVAPIDGVWERVVYTESAPEGGAVFYRVEVE